MLLRRVHVFHLDGDGVDEGEAVAGVRHLLGAGREGAHVDLRLDHAGDGRVVEDADAVQEELVAREGADVGVVEDLSVGRRLDGPCHCFPGNRV